MLSKFLSLMFVFGFSTLTYAETNAAGSRFTVLAGTAQSKYSEQFAGAQVSLPAAEYVSVVASATRGLMFPTGVFTTDYRDAPVTAATANVSEVSLGLGWRLFQQNVDSGTWTASALTLLGARSTSFALNTHADPQTLRVTYAAESDSRVVDTSSQLAGIGLDVAWHHAQGFTASVGANWKAPVSYNASVSGDSPASHAGRADDSAQEAANELAKTPIFSAQVSMGYQI